MPCWQDRLRQEWITAPDNAAREHLLQVYQPKLAGLPNRELEKLLAELQDLKPRRCNPRDSA